MNERGQFKRYGVSVLRQFRTSNSVVNELIRLLDNGIIAAPGAFFKIVDLKLARSQWKLPHDILKAANDQKFHVNSIRDGMYTITCNDRTYHHLRRQKQKQSADVFDDDDDDDDDDGDDGDDIDVDDNDDDYEPTSPGRSAPKRSAPSREQTDDTKRVRLATADVAPASAAPVITAPVNVVPEPNPAGLSSFGHIVDMVVVAAQQRQNQQMSGIAQFRNDIHKELQTIAGIISKMADHDQATTNRLNEMSVRLETMLARLNVLEQSNRTRNNTTTTAGSYHWRNIADSYS